MNKTKIFPYDFLNDDTSAFYIRLLPNLTSIGTIGDAMVTGNQSKKSEAGASLSRYHYYSYAVINNWNDMNRYVRNEVSIIRYGKSIYDFIIKFANFPSIFDTQSSYCIKLNLKYKEGYPYFENYYFQSNENIIYDPNHPGKNDKELIKKFLLDRDISLEQLAIESSDGPHKSDLKKKYADIIRNEKLKSIGI